MSTVSTVSFCALLHFLKKYQARRRYLHIHSQLFMINSLSLLCCLTFLPLSLSLVSLHSCSSVFLSHSCSFSSCSSVIVWQFICLTLFLLFSFSYCMSLFLCPAGEPSFARGEHAFGAGEWRPGTWTSQQQDSPAQRPRQRKLNRDLLNFLCVCVCVLSSWKSESSLMSGHPTEASVCYMWQQLCKNQFTKHEGELKCSVQQNVNM